MKKTILCILLALLLCLSLGAPILADEPEQVWYFYDTLGITSTEEDNEIETRLNTLSQGEIGVYAVLIESHAEFGDSLEDAAEGIFAGMDFGNGDAREGVLLLAETETSDGALYVNGDKAAEVFTPAEQDVILAHFYDTDTWYDAMIAYADDCETLLDGGTLLDGPGTDEPEEDEWFFFDVDGVMLIDEEDAIDAQFRSISETYGVGIYGAVVTTSSEYADSAEEAAQFIYEVMEFGKENGGVFLLSVVDTDKQVLYADGKAAELFSGDAETALLERFAAQLPLYQDAYTVFGNDCETLLRGGTLTAAEPEIRTGPAETEAPIVIAPAPTEAPAPEETPAPAPAAGPASEPQSDPEPEPEPEFDWHVYDIAGLLTEDEVDALEQKLTRISDKYDCGVYFASVEDYRDYGDGSIEDVAQAIFTGEDFGVGTNADGVFLLMSMDDRDFHFLSHGYWGNEAFSDRAKDKVIEAFKDDFRSDDWNSGLNDWADECENMLSLAAAGEPYGVGMPTGTKLLIIFIPALLIAGIACAVMLGKMKSVRMAADADAYTTPGSLNVTEATDIFTHTTQTRRKIESSSRSGGGGGGFSGKSGKF